MCCRDPLGCGRCCRKRVSAATASWHRRRRGKRPPPRARPPGRSAQKAEHPVALASSTLAPVWMRLRGHPRCRAPLGPEQASPGTVSTRLVPGLLLPPHTPGPSLGNVEGPCFRVGFLSPTQVPFTKNSQISTTLAHEPLSELPCKAGGHGSLLRSLFTSPNASVSSLASGPSLTHSQRLALS